MLNNSNLFLVICTVCISVVFTQSRTDDPGVSIDGSTGLFLNPSPETLSVGHVQLGLSRSYPMPNHKLNSTIPLAISLGLTSRSELYYSTNSWYISSLEKEKNLTLGLRLKLLDFEKSITSVDFRWKNIELFTDDKSSFKSQRILSRVITKFSIFNLKTYANIGYSSSLESVGSKFDNRFIGGVGVLFPIVKRLQGVLDFQIDEHESVNKMVIGSIALKWFLFNHIQLASGFNYDVYGGVPLKGVFLNLSISSNVMKGPRKRVRTKQGLPLPPKLPKEYFTVTNIIETPNLNISEQSHNIKLPLSVYVENFFEKDYTNELPLIPPISELESWRIEILSMLDEKNTTKSELVEEELPYPPLLEKIEFPSFQKSGRKKLIEVNKVIENTTISLPNPPPLYIPNQ